MIVDIKRIDKGNIKIRKVAERKITETGNRVIKHKSAGISNDTPMRFILKTDNTIKTTAEKKPDRIYTKTERNTSVKIERPVKTESSSFTKQSSASFHGVKVSKDRLKRMEQKRLERQYGGTDKTRTIERIDKKIGSDTNKTEIQSRKELFNNYKKDKTPREKKKIIGKVSEDRLKRMEEKRKNRETNKLIAAMKNKEKKEDNQKKREENYKSKEMRKLGENRTGKEGRIKDDVTAEKGKDLFQGKDRKKRGEHLKRIGSKAYNEGTTGARKVKNEVLDNVEGGEDLNKAIHLGVSQPIKYSIGSMKFLKQRKEGIKIRRQSRQIKKELKRKEDALYAEFYAKRGNKAGKKEFKKLRRINKKNYKKTNTVKGLKGRSIKSMGVNFFSNAATSVKGRMIQKIKGNISGLTGARGSGDAGQQGGDSLMSSVGGIFARGGLALLKFFVIKFKIQIIVLLGFIMLATVLASAVPMVLLSSPFAIIAFLGSGGESADGILKEKFTNFNTEIQTIISQKGGMVNLVYEREEGVVDTNFNDILAVFAVMYGSNGELSDGKVSGKGHEGLEELFRYAVLVRTNFTKVQEAGHESDSTEVTITLRNWKSIADHYRLSDEEKAQVEQIYNMLKESSLSEDIALPISGNMGDYIWYGDLEPSEIQKRIVENAKTNNGWYPATAGYCAKWVAGIYANSGATRPHGDAKEYWYKWKSTGSSDKTNIPLGAAVITDGASVNSNYGHIGIYIGNGMVASNIGGVKIESVESFANGKYGPWLGWCWPDGKVLQPEVTADTSGWKVGTASAYGAAAGDAYIADNLITATGEAVTANSMGVAIPMAWSNFRSYYGKTVIIEYKGKVVTAKINDCGGMGNGSRALDLQPGVIKAFGFTSCNDWGLRQVKYKIL